MYQMIIVDNEPIERQAVRFLLDKYKFPFHITEAANGKEALELMQKKNFDILFTDIEMPFMDGLKLAAKARAQYPNLQIIFFSGHDDFNYVKEALSISIVNYILKPIDPEEFQKTISDVLKRLQAQEEQAEKRKFSSQFTKSHILHKLLNQTRMEQLEKQYPHLDLSFSYAYHRLFLIQTEQSPTASGISEPFPLFSGQNKLFPQECDHLNLNPIQDLLLFYGPKHHDKWYEDLAARLAQHMEKQYHTNCYVAISQPFHSPDDLYSAYKQTERYLLERFFFTEDSVFSSNSVHKEQRDSFSSLMEQLYADIQFRDPVSLRQHMTTFFEILKNSQNRSHIYVRYQCTNVLELLLKNVHDSTKDSFEKYIEAIYHLKHFSEIESMLLALTDKIAQTMSEDAPSASRVLDQVKHYIHNHYGEDLSLDILSREACLSPRYLSSLFIKETGYGINKYIKEVRMEKAKELLLNTNLKVTEICSRVGYSNLSYFCKNFAEQFGITPDKFRSPKK